MRQYQLELSNRCENYTVHHSSSTTKSHVDDYNNPTTPGTKRSAPIAIELPGRNPHTVYTPLSARGDLPGYVLPPWELEHNPIVVSSAMLKVL